jgi:hypothetical protein
MVPALVYSLPLPPLPPPQRYPQPPGLAVIGRAWYPSMGYLRLGLGYLAGYQLLGQALLHVGHALVDGR